MTTHDPARRGRRARGTAGTPSVRSDTSERRRGGHSRLHRRVAGALAIGLGLLATAGLYAAATADVNTAQAQAADAALMQRGQELYNENACISCHGANLQGVESRGAEPDRRRRGRRVLPGLQRADAAGPPGGAGQRKPPLPIFDPDTEEGQANLDALGAYIQANGGGPTAPGGTRRGAARRRPGARRRAVPAQLRVVPQLHRPRRRAVVGQVRPARSTRRARRRSTRRC